jgi:acetyl-CoA carboxylase carboxyl transferase subunit alpha
MLENTWYSVISPESCSTILWRNTDHKMEAASALKLTADDMFNNKLVDGIIREPLGGAHNNPDEAIQIMKQAILSMLDELEQKDVNTLVNERIEKFCSMGVVQQ